MSRLLVIGCGGVASVAIQKCCQNSKVFTELCIASRTKEKCDALKEKIQDKTDTVITTAKVDADSKEELVALINSYKPGCGPERGPSLSGFDRYGCLPGVQGGLH